MRLLKQRFNLEYLPKVYFKKRMQLASGNRSETILMSLSEWFQGYHEWHLSIDNTDRQQAVIWDLEQGYRSALKEEIRVIYRDASKVLTLHYDISDFHQICPWHQATGDFVVIGDREDVSMAYHCPNI
nr:hypothetical protein [Desulfobacterales bacterium]